MKKVFLAGASGVIGIRVCKILLQKGGYEIYGTTRSEQKAKILKDMGVKPVIVDVFDADKLEDEMMDIRPDIVLHQLTDLPSGLPADKMPQALVRNARIRDEGTRNLVNASVKSGAKKIISQSIAFVYEPNDKPFTEDSKLLNFKNKEYGETSEAIYSLEQQTINAPFVGIVLRNGWLYGDDTGFDAAVEGLACVHVDAAANAVVLAMEYDKSSIFNIVDEDDAKTPSLKAVKELGWSDKFRL